MSLEIYSISKKNKISETCSQPALSIYQYFGQFLAVEGSLKSTS